jgi:putative ABC transport system ATP-binding protein
MAVIQAKNLRMEYCSNEGEPTIALDGVDFSIERGEFVSIMGPSGSGKSTLLHILGMLDRQTQGTYLFDGRNSADYSQDELAAIRNEKMGFVFQAFNLLARTSVLENVKLPLLYSKKKEGDWDRLALSAIKKVGLEHRIQHQPNQLSGGEKQRVAIARALINNPEVIFADEPTGNLDSKSGAIVMDTLMQLNEKENKTVILITHEHSTAKYAERIIHIKDGKIESDEKVRERSFVQNGYLK